MADMAHLIEPVIPRYDATPKHSCATPEMRTIWFRTPWSERWAAASAAIRRRHAYVAFHHPAQPGGQTFTADGEAWPGRFPLDDAGELDVAVPSTQEDALRHDDILAAVGQLPDDQRGVLLLVSIEDVSYAEAARILDIPIGTVMSRLARARAGF